jgi:hypothetical protein
MCFYLISTTLTILTITVSYINALDRRYQCFCSFICRDSREGLRDSEAYAAFSSLILLDSAAFIS